MESTIAGMTKEEVLKISLTCGKLLLTSGAETYRVEDTMTRICALKDMQIAAVSTPSWIMVGDETVDGPVWSPASRGGGRISPSSAK